MRFMIDYDPDMNYSKYILFRKEYWYSKWKRIGGFDTLDKAREELLKAKEFPQYFP